MKQTLTALTILMAAGACQPAANETPASPGAVSSPASADEIAAESARLFDFVETYFNEAVRRSPISQTYLGIKTDYDKWDDVSNAAAEREFQIGQDALTALREQFDLETLDASGQLTYRLFEYQREREAANFPFRKHSYIFNQMFGQQSSIPAFLINQHRVASESDLQAYISRLEGVEAYLGQHLANAKERAEMGIRPPAFVYDYVRQDAVNILAGAPFDTGSDVDSPLLADFKGKLANLDLDDAEKEDYLAQATDALGNSVGPAYRDLIAFFDAELEVATTEDGVWKLPEGEAYYTARLAHMTTTDMTPDEIHDLGLAEVARIQSEMRAIMEEVEFDGSLRTSSLTCATPTDRSFMRTPMKAGPATLPEAEAHIDAMKARLPEMFSRQPKADLIVKAVEPFRERSAGKAFYQRPSPDGSRPGTYYANLYRMEDMPTYQMEALAFHEGVPGHHMQLAIAQELEAVPQFRKFGGYTAYTEGWGLYSEYFPKELGFYADPYSDFGRLAMEIWRAARLVVDTGLHHKKWTREDAVQYLLDNTPNPAGDAQKAIDRYIVMPGQATAYKVGMLKILELRETAKAELGDDFDIRGFHDTVIEQGPVPLDVLEELVDAWIAETKSS